jgi:O-antigen/teichoic acid export membrane protein
LLCRVSLPFQVSRFQQFVQGVGSSWIATLATVLYSLLSVPIALRYLTTEEFGLFVLLLQVATYFALIEIGMASATSRILIDYKDRPDDGEYGATILTGFCVFAVQALVVLTVGLVAAPWIVTVIGVPANFNEVATLLLRWLAFTSALTLASRVYGSILYANKRLDLINVLMGGNVLFSLAVLTIILTAGGGLTGLVWLFLSQAGFSIILSILACHWLGLLPGKGKWGRPSMKRFKEIFVFGKDIFLFNVGNQVLEASQLIIVTRAMGLPAAAIWSVSTKLFMLVYQLVTKLEGTAIVFFSEMMVRGETRKLASRFRQIYQMTAGVAFVALVAVVGVNIPFVSVWANSSLAWSLQLSALMALVVLGNTLTRCSADLIIHTKNLGAFRFLYFAEAIAFVLLALWISRWFGFYGILVASLTCLILFRATYTTWRVARYFQLPPTTFWWSWLKRPILAAFVLLPFMFSAEWICSGASDAWTQLLIAGVWIGMPATITLFTLALPSDVKEELSLRWRQSYLVKRY